MLLPQTLTATLIVMIFGMLCLSTWATTFKSGGNWRFELYYFDFAVGVVLMGLLLALTAGSYGYDGFQFTDDLLHAGKRQWFFAFVAGLIFNLGNMLLTAAMSVTGIAVAFPIGIGCAVVVGTLLSLLLRHPGNPFMMLAGCLVLIAAAVVAGMSFSALRVQRHEEMARAGKAKSLRRPSSAKGILLAIVAGIVMGTFAPLIANAAEGDLGLGPYSVNALFGIGVFVSTFAYNMFFINLPVEGEPVEIREYFKKRPTIHLLGAAGGALWMAGTTALMVGSMAPGNPQMANLGAPPNFMLSWGFPVITALLGLLVYKEFAGANGRIKAMLAATIVLYAAGVVLIALAPLYIRAV